jgi:hypothetical protein
MAMKRHRYLLVIIERLPGVYSAPQIIPPLRGSEIIEPAIRSIEQILNSKKGAPTHFVSQLAAWGLSFRLSLCEIDVGVVIASFNVILLDQSAHR